MIVGTISALRGCCTLRRYAIQIFVSFRLRHPAGLEATQHDPPRRALTMGGAHSRPASETELRAAFRDVDMHDTGFIEVDEITSSLQLLYKVHSSAMAVREIMAAADTNSDGSLSYREFKLMLHKYGSLLPPHNSRDFADVRVLFGGSQIPLGLKVSRHGQLTVTSCDGLTKAAGIAPGAIIVEIAGKPTPLNITLIEFGSILSKMRDSKLPVLMGFKLKDDEAPTARGVLLKRGQFSKHWREYDIDVRDGQLFYGPSGSKGKKIIDLRTYEVTNVGGHGSEAFDLASDAKTLHLATTSSDDLQMWTTVLKTASDRRKLHCTSTSPAAETQSRSHPPENMPKALLADEPPLAELADVSGKPTWDEADVFTPRRAPGRVGAVSKARKQSRSHHHTGMRKRETNSPSPPRHPEPNGLVTPRPTHVVGNDDGDYPSRVNPDAQESCSFCTFWSDLVEALAATAGKDPARAASPKRVS